MSDGFTRARMPSVVDYGALARACLRASKCADGEARITAATLIAWELLPFSVAVQVVAAIASQGKQKKGGA